MDANLRIITHLPVIKVGRGDGFSTTKRGKFLTREDVLRFLKSGAVQFVVADIGAPPSWIPDVRARHLAEIFRTKSSSHGCAQDDTGNQDVWCE